MPVEVLSGRFHVNEKSNATKSSSINTLILSNDTTEILLDIFFEFIEIEENDTVDIILYNGNVSDKDVAEEYNYVMNGRMYEVDEKYVGSFGGLRFEMKMDKEVGLDDRCDMAIAMRRL